MVAESTASWNSWVDAQDSDGVASVNGVPVRRLHCYVDDSSYCVCRNADKQLDRRSELLETLNTWRPKPDRMAEQFKFWKEAAETFLSDLYSLHEAAAFISQRYFDCRKLLVPDLEGYLANLIKEAEEVVGMFNDLCTDETEPSSRIDPEEIRKCAGTKAAEEMALLVAMAKAEALDMLGEERAARELAERHL